jgi:hypothetical protein
VRIHKYEVPTPEVDSTVVSMEMPSGARILTVQPQMERPRIWVAVSDDAQPVQRRFRVVPTGIHFEEEEDLGTYVGTFQLYGGQLVFHLFDLGETT